MLSSCSVSFGMPDENSSEISSESAISKNTAINKFRNDTDEETETSGDKKAETKAETTISKNVETKEIKSETTADTTIKDDANTVPANYSGMSVSQIIDSMTINQKAAQMILARCPTNAISQMEKYQFGGYTLYGDDFKGETPDTVKKRISDIQNSAIIPAFIAVDEEGGNVVRISKYKAFTSSPFLSPQDMIKNDSLVQDTTDKCDLLLSLGINFNLAPVADITDNKSDYMYNRTFGLSAVKTGENISNLVGIMNDKGVASCLKHFPGYGSNVDTHTGIAVDTRSKSDFEGNDFIPFEYGINANCPAVLVNHNIINAYNDSLPASLAPEVHDVLRTELGFSGVIVTDDLGMDAIKLYTGSENVNVLAVLAGNDLLCVTDSVQCYNDIIDAVNKGTISEKRLDESVKRILLMKRQYGII